MKKLFLLFLVSMLLSGCERIQTPSHKVDVTFQYTLSQSGSPPVTLATGKYRVVGTSNGGATANDHYKIAVLVFDEEIEITEATTKSPREGDDSSH